MNHVITFVDRLRKKIFCSRCMAIKNRHSWFMENPLFNPQNQTELCFRENSNFGRKWDKFEINYAQKS